MSDPYFDPDTGEIIEATDEQPQAGSSRPEAMSLDDARALLVREHGVAIGNDDPLLMAVTLHQGFVADLARLQTNHEKRIERVLGATGEALGEAVEGVLDKLREKAIRANLETAFALVEAQARSMEKLERTMRRLRWWMLAAVILVASCVGLGFAFLFSIIR